jgi:uncharacterized membrane protein YhaH (DUF805 family)
MSTSVAANEAPLQAPLYGATLGQAVSRFFRKYATFTGRASRSEYWWWMLVNILVSTVLYVISLALGTAGATVTETGSVPGPGFMIGVVLSMVWALAVLVPGLALTWRRLHDTNRSGAFFFLALIPFVGGIILLVFTVLPSDPAGARFD